MGCNTEILEIMYLGQSEQFFFETEPIMSAKSEKSYILNDIIRISRISMIFQSY